MQDKIRKTRFPILIVEDRMENQLLLKNLCANMGLKSVMAENGRVGLDRVAEQEFSIFIVDLMMPVMDGITFIRHLKEINPEAVVLVQTALDSPETIVETMKVGVFDYIIKPIDNDLFERVLERALEYKYLKDFESNLVKNAGMKLRGQLDWLMNRDAGMDQSQEKVDRRSIQNLKTSLSQGYGVGAMVSLVEMIAQDMRPDGDSYLVDKSLLDLLLVNNRMTRLSLAGLDEVVKLMDQEIQPEVMNETEFKRLVQSAADELVEFTSQRNQTLEFHAAKSDIQVMVDAKLLKKALREIILNASKYGDPQTRIDIQQNISEGYVCLSVRNQLTQDSKITEDNARLLMEPFFRILPIVEDALEFEEYSMGLGLTVVDYIIKMHNGLVFIQSNAVEEGDIVNHVIVDLFLPLQLTG